MTDTPITKQWDPKLIIVEAYRRLMKDSPRFFKVWQLINVIMAAIALTPILLDMADIVLFPKWATALSKMILVAGIWGKLMTKLPVSEPDPQTMPFTQKKEIQQIVEDFKKEVPPSNIIT